MPASTIQFTDKDKLGNAPESLWRDIDANEVKAVVNAHATDIDNQVAAFGGILQSLNNLGDEIDAKVHSSQIQETSFNPFAIAGIHFRTYVCGAENIEVQLGSLSGPIYNYRCRIVALGFPVTIVPQDPSTQILTGPTTVPVGGVVEITRVNIGAPSLTRFVVLPLFTP